MDRDILYIEMYKLFKRRRAWIGPVLVFLLIIISFPLTLDINSDNPPQIYLSFIWISTLLVTMLGTELIFSDDFEDGTLEQYAVNDQLIEVVFYKISCPLGIDWHSSCFCCFSIYLIFGYLNTDELNCFAMFNYLKFDFY